MGSRKSLKNSEINVCKTFSKFLVLVSCYCLAESNWFLFLTWSLQIIMVLLCIQSLYDCWQWKCLKRSLKKRPQAVQEPRTGGCYDHFIRAKCTKSSVQEPGWSPPVCRLFPSPSGNSLHTAGVNILINTASWATFRPYLILFCVAQTSVLLSWNWSAILTPARMLIQTTWDDLLSRVIRAECKFLNLTSHKSSLSYLPASFHPSFPCSKADCNPPAPTEIKNFLICVALSTTSILS